MKKGMIIATLGLAISPMSLYASETELITIIGPDGRPMNIERKVAKPKVKAKLANRSQPINLKETLTQQSIRTTEQQAVVISNNPASFTAPSSSSTGSQISEETLPVQTQSVISQPTNTDLSTTVKPLAKSSLSEDNSSTSISQPNVTSTVENSPFMQLEGEEYVDSDYLEQSEFNLEGKKRFYHIPSLDGAPVEVVERKKGLNLNFFNRMQKQRETIEHKPVVFAATYTRIEQDTVQDMLAQQCIDPKSLKKAKTFNSEKARHLWPSRPLNNEFDFSLVKLEHTMQDVQIISFASNDNKPTYYWPLVVFLNEKGCIEEGVMGFRNGQQSASAIQHSAIEGVIRIPATTKYILMTPLEVAIDAEDYQLSNEGQLKLVVLR